MLGRMMADDTQTPGKSIDINRVMKLLPHRYPFLLIDKMVDIHGEESGTAIKNVTINEPFFQGHFPARPVMPGVLLVEAMAQAAGAIVLENLGDSDAGKLVFFMSIDKCRFRKPVGPGDQVHFHVKLLQKRAPVWKYWAEAHVDGKKVAEAEIGAMLIDERPA
jgi:3-hydroxyacyl-[acyl-carrier-protein] dehydratase